MFALLAVLVPVSVVPLALLSVLGTSGSPLGAFAPSGELVAAGGTGWRAESLIFSTSSPFESHVR